LFEAKENGFRAAIKGSDEPGMKNQGFPEKSVVVLGASGESVRLTAGFANN
jgi:hypothetical protein